MKLSDEQKSAVIAAATQWGHNTTILFTTIKRAVPGITDEHYGRVMNAVEARKNLANVRPEDRASVQAVNDAAYIAAIESL